MPKSPLGYTYHFDDDGDDDDITTKMIQLHNYRLQLIKITAFNTPPCIDNHEK
jgi:hypothetical protein